MKLKSTLCSLVAAIGVISCGPKNYQGEIEGHQIVQRGNLSPIMNNLLELPSCRISIYNYNGSGTNVCYDVGGRSEDNPRIILSPTAEMAEELRELYPLLKQEINQ